MHIGASHTYHTYIRTHTTLWYIMCVCVFNVCLLHTQSYHKVAHKLNAIIIYSKSKLKAQKKSFVKCLFVFISYDYVDIARIKRVVLRLRQGICYVSWCLCVLCKFVLVSFVEIVSSSLKKDMLKLFISFSRLLRLYSKSFDIHLYTCRTF